MKHTQKFSTCGFRRMVMFGLLAIGFPYQSLGQVKATYTPTLTPTLTPTPTLSFIPTPMISSEGIPNGEYLGNGKVRIYGGPIWYHDSLGNLHKINETAISESANPSGKKRYSMDKRAMKADLIAGTTREFLTIRDDRDWQFPNRALKITLISTKWSGREAKIAPETDFQKSSGLFQTEKLSIQIAPNAARIFSKREGDAFSIVYQIDSGDLVCDCIQGDLSEYTFMTPEGKTRGKIYPPRAANANFEFLDNASTSYHSLVKVSDGTYLYTKSGTISNSDVVWMDADIFYGGNESGYINSFSSTSWSSAFSGSSLLVSKYDPIESTTYGSTDNDRFSISRIFLTFDSSSLPDWVTISSCDLYMYRYESSYLFTSFHIQQGTQGSTLEATDWNQYTGGQIGCFNWWGVPDSWNNTSISTSVINKTGNTCFVVREYRDYTNSGENDGVDYGSQFGGGLGSYKPYLSIVTVSTPTPTYTPTFTPTATPTATHTYTPTPTPTFTNTPTYTPTATATYTSTPTYTPTATATYTSTPTYTPTATLTSTPTITPTFNPTATPTPQSIHIDVPNGGETWVIGDPADITFSISAYGVSSATLELSTDNGLSWGTIIAATSFINNASTTHRWGAIDSSPSEDARVRVSLANQFFNDISDATFVIFEPTPSPTVTSTPSPTSTPTPTPSPTLGPSPTPQPIFRTQADFPYIDDFWWLQTQQLAFNAPLYGGIRKIIGDDSRFIFQSDVNIYLDPTNGGTANGIIQMATIVQFDDFLGDIIQFNQSYSIGSSPSTFELTSDRDFAFNSTTLPNLMTIDGNVGDVSINGSLQSQSIHLNPKNSFPSSVNIGTVFYHDGSGGTLEGLWVLTSTGWRHVSFD